MNESVSFKRWLAHALLRRAQKLLPTSRLEWAKAMQTELDHLENDDDALAWAMGCVVAGSKERISTMFAANLKISSLGAVHMLYLAPKRPYESLPAS